MKRSLFLFLPFLALIRKSGGGTLEGVTGGQLMGFLEGEWAYVENNDWGSVIRHKETTIASVESPLFFRNGETAVFSPNGRFFAVICSRREGELTGHSGFRTAAVHIYGCEKGIWSLRYEMPFTQFPDRYKRLMEMGAVSNDGTKTLLKCGIVHPFNGQVIIMHEWETWSIAGERVGKGLSV